MRDWIDTFVRVAALAVVITVAAGLFSMAVGCGSTPKPKPVDPPRPPATIVVTPDPLPCILPKAPAPLAPSGAIAVPGGRWVLLDEVGHHGHELTLANGIHVPRDRWDELGRYILALQDIVIAAKRCHPEAP